MFELKANHNTISVVSFNSGNGTSPYGVLHEDGGGNLFGTTYDGGPSDQGNLLEVLGGGLGGMTITTLVNLSTVQQCNARAGVIEGGDGQPRAAIRG